MNHRICSHCHRFLQINKFERYSGERGKKKGKSSFSSMCKECRSELRLINLLRKKYKIIKKYFNGKCSECEIGLEYLPSFEFHHLDSSLKKKTWTNIKHQSIANIEKWLKTENVILLCSNCHELKKEKYFRDFKKIILMSNIFEYSPYNIDELINQSINRHPKYRNCKNYKRNIKVLIKKYIRKRFVFEQIFFGKCIGCNNKNILYLPILELHHRKPNNLAIKSTWRDLSDLDCESIIDRIIGENCVCLCSNCHILINSKIHLFLKDVIDDKDTLKLLELNYQKVISNIQKFNFNKEKYDFRSPLNLLFSQKDFWKIRLLQISIILKNKNILNFKVMDLREQLNHKKRSIRYYLDRLINLGYLMKFQESNFPFDNYYSLSNKGIEKLRLIKENHRNTYLKLKKDINCMEFYMNRQNLWIK